MIEARQGVTVAGAVKVARRSNPRRDPTIPPLALRHEDNQTAPQHQEHPKGGGPRRRADGRARPRSHGRRPSGSGRDVGRKRQDWTSRAACASRPPPWSA
jgi:hypothetical protein